MNNTERKAKFAETAQELKGKLLSAAANLDKKKRISIAVAIGVFLVALLVVDLTPTANTGGRGKLSAEMEAAAKERTQLVVGVSETWCPPFVYMGFEGEFEGTDVELMKQVCEYYGWELIIEPIAWDKRSDLLTNQTVDCLWNGFISYGREDNYAWTDPYLDTSDVIVVKKGSLKIKDLDGLEGKRVAAVKGTSAFANLESIGIGMERLGCNDVERCMSLLKSGEADAVAVSKTEASKLKGVKVIDECLSYQTFAVACDKENTMLAELLDYGIKTVRLAKEGNKQ